MADLRISELAALAGANLAAGDLLPIADVSASETKKITVTDLVGRATTLIADATIPSGKILFGNNTIPGASLTTSSVTATQLANDAVTAAKLADESSVDLVTTLPGSGAFVGQIALDTDDSKIYCWNGSSWISVKGAGSVNAVFGSTSGVINIVATTVGDEVTISATLDNTTAAAEFLAGPTASAGTVGYRPIVGADLPTATTTTKGAVIVNGNGLTLAGDTISINNTVTAETTNYHVVQYNAKGLVTAGRLVDSSDLPVATSLANGIVKPGTGLGVTAGGTVNHTNVVAPTTGTKVSFDSEGHVTGTQSLVESDIPGLPASKITSGTLDNGRIGTNTIIGSKLGNYSVTQIGSSLPTAEHIGQFFFNPISRDLSLWDGNVYQSIGISAGEIVLAGTYNATTNLLTSVTAEGAAAGFTNGSPLPSAAAKNNRYYVVVATGGTGTSPAPTVALQPPDIILSNGSSYILIDVSETVTSQVATNVVFTPTGNISAINVQSAIAEVDSEKVAKAGDLMTGALGITAGSAGSPSLYISGDTNTGFWSPSADAIAASTGGSERARIDSSGRLLVGTSTVYSVPTGDGAAYFPSFQVAASTFGGSSLSAVLFNTAAGGGGSLQLGRSNTTTVGNQAVAASNDIAGSIFFTASDGTAQIRAARIEAAVDGTPGANSMPGRIVLSTTSSGASSPTERMRISSAGDVMVSGTDADPAINGTASAISLRNDGRISARGPDNFPTMSLARGGTDGAVVRFYKTTTDVGNISLTTTATAYNTSSDYRLKENVVPLTGAIDRVNDLQVRRFNFIADPDKTVDGFLAHEAQAVVPECVTGTKDEVDADGNPVYQGIDQSKLVPLLTAALQEALAEIEFLKARVTALEP
jgi:hypothetical protein